jgi:hypothetical protein
MSAEMEFDDEIRANVAATRPDCRPAIGQISARANALRRRAQFRMAGIASVLVVLTAGVAYALPSGGHPSSLNVSAPHGHRGHHGTHAHTTTVPTTLPSVRGSVPTTLGGVVPPSTPRPHVSTPVSSPSGTTPSTLLGSPPTTDGGPVTAPPTTVGSPAPPTTQAPPNYPPIKAGDTRLVIVLDDAGLHAPASFPQGRTVEILFDDRRSVANGSELLEGGYSPASGAQFDIPPWFNGDPAPRTSILTHGTLTFFAVAAMSMTCHCTWNGAPASITITRY